MGTPRSRTILSLLQMTIDDLVADDFKNIIKEDIVHKEQSFTSIPYNNFLQHWINYGMPPKQANLKITY